MQTSRGMAHTDRDPKSPAAPGEDELERMARELGVTREELRSAVQIGGPLAGDLKKEGDESAPPSPP
ncbi:MAG TPA: hypothetical protein VFB08_02045 [Burkholderiales bacterium]|nr:hypothetical protein [Burkholderiales bacterium]